MGVDLDGYVGGADRSVPGWFSPEDKRLFALTNEVQREAGINGDLLEIGVYKGRSAILLGYMAGGTDQLVTCDLFGSPATNEYSARENATTYGDLDQEQFEANYLRFHNRLPNIVRGPSSALHGQCEKGSFRFVHIDGSHMYPDVMGDLLLSRDLVVGPDAVIVIDDIRTPHTPGVWAATWECVYRHGLRPLIVSEKMYATWGEPTPALAVQLRIEIEGHPELIAEEHPLAEGSILHVRSRQGRRERLLQRSRESLRPAKTAIRTHLSKFQR